MNISEYGKLSDLVDSDDVTELEKALRLGHHNGTALGLLLLDAVENGSKRCFRLLLGHEDAIKLGGPTALGAATREGDLEMVRALLDADVDLSRPKWQFDADEDHAIRGAMLSMDPEIVEAICSAGAVEQADVGWINEAMEIANESKERERWEALVVFGRHLADRLNREPDAMLDERALQNFAARLEKTEGRSKAAALKIAALLSQKIDRDVAFEKELIDRVVHEKDFDYVLDRLNELSGSRADQLADKMLVWIARSASSPRGPSPNYGWDAFEQLLERGVALDAVDDYGRTAMVYVVRRTEGREALIERMLRDGADINALDVDHDGINRSIYDWSQLGFARQAYGPFLRERGAKTAEELLQAEKRES